MEDGESMLRPAVGRAATREIATRRTIFRLKWQFLEPVPREKLVGRGSMCGTAQLAGAG